MLLVLTGLDSGVSTTSGKMTTNKCMIKYSAKDIKKFADSVWRLDKWERGEVNGQIKIHYRHILSCAKGPGHKKNGKDYWRKSKRAYYAHRAYKRQWGNCNHSGPVDDCIHGAAIEYRADESWMINVSLCESHWERYAENPSGSKSIFQFLSSTWATTPYAAKDIWSVKWQSLAAAWMNVVGRSGEWVCTG